MAKEWFNYVNTLIALQNFQNILSRRGVKDLPLLPEDETGDQRAIRLIIELCGEIYHEYTSYPICEGDPD